MNIPLTSLSGCIKKQTFFPVNSIFSRFQNTLHNSIFAICHFYQGQWDPCQMSLLPCVPRYFKNPFRSSPLRFAVIKKGSCKGAFSISVISGSDRRNGGHVRRNFHDRGHDDVYILPLH